MPEWTQNLRVPSTHNRSHIHPYHTHLPCCATTQTNNIQSSYGDGQWSMVGRLLGIRFDAALDELLQRSRSRCCGGGGEMEHGYRLHFRCMYHSHLASVPYLPPTPHAAFITSGSCCGCEPESCTSWRRFRVHILAAIKGRW